MQQYILQLKKIQNAISEQSQQYHFKSRSIKEAIPRNTQTNKNNSGDTLLKSPNNQISTILSHLKVREEHFATQQWQWIFRFCLYWGRLCLMCLTPSLTIIQLIFAVEEGAVFFRSTTFQLWRCYSSIQFSFSRILRQLKCSFDLEACKLQLSQSLFPLILCQKIKLHIFTCKTGLHFLPTSDQQISLRMVFLSLLIRL